MAQREQGWPLGLPPLNGRIGLAPHREMSERSLSISTLLTRSLTSSMSSSDLDTESTGSLKGITLGSLIGISSMMELSQRSIGGRTLEIQKTKKNCKFKPPWVFSLCSKLDADAVSTNNAPPSLGHFLKAERRASRP